MKEQMVKDGFTWQYMTYDRKGEYITAQAEAKAAKRGLWADPKPVSP